jgi:hypothetical protein
VEAEAIDHHPVIGMRLLERSDVHIEVWVGGIVTVTAVP